MNALIALMIIGGGIVCVFALVSIWDKTEKARLLKQAERAVERTSEDTGIALPGEPDEAWWGNRCLVVLYINAGIVVTSAEKVAQVIPVRAIRECMSVGSTDSTGNSSLMFTFNDPTNPEVNLNFPGDGATHAQRAISALITLIIEQAQLPPPPVLFEEDGEEEDERETLAPGQMIDSTPYYEQNIILEAPKHDSEKGETLVIN